LSARAEKNLDLLSKESKIGGDKVRNLIDQNVSGSSLIASWQHERVPKPQQRKKQV